MKKIKYVEQFKKKLNLTQEEAEKAVSYLEGLIVNIIKEELKDYDKQN